MDYKVSHYRSEAEYATDKWRNRKKGSRYDRNAYHRACRRAARKECRELARRKAA